MTVVLIVTFAVLTFKLRHRPPGHHPGDRPPRRPGRLVHPRGHRRAEPGDLVGQLRLGLQPVPAGGDTKKPVFWYTFAGLVLSYVGIQAIGIAGAKALGDQTAVGIRDVMGGGFLGGAGPARHRAWPRSRSNAMNDYSGSLALQTVGVRVRRPLSALVVDRHRVLPDPVAALGRHRVAVPERAAVRRLLDSGVLRHRRHRLVLPGPRAAHDQSRRCERTDPDRRDRGPDRFRGRVRRRGAVHEHQHLRRPGRSRPGTAPTWPTSSTSSSPRSSTGAIGSVGPVELS